MAAMLLSAINGTIFLVGIAASSLTPLFEQDTLIIWSCRLRIKEPFGFNSGAMWCLSPPRCFNGYQRFVGEISWRAEGGGEEVTRIPSLGNSNTKYILKQWMALEARSDWLLNLRLSFAIHLRSTCAGFAPENIMIVAGINELKSSFCATSSRYFRIY